MLVTKTQIINSLRLLCRKFDNKKAKGSTFRYLKKNYDIDAFVKLALYEINGFSLDSSPYPKHKRVAGLWTFTKDGFKHTNTFSLTELIEDMADFISSSQIDEKRLLEKMKRPIK